MSEGIFGEFRRNLRMDGASNAVSLRCDEKGAEIAEAIESLFRKFFDVARCRLDLEVYHFSKGGARL